MPFEPSSPELHYQRELLRVLTAARAGDFTARMPLDYVGVEGKVADTLNEVLGQNLRVLAELERLRVEVGREGRTSQRAVLPAADGGWKLCIDAINGLLDDTVRPTAALARVVGAVGKGDLSQSVPLEVEGQPLRGDFLQTARTVNGMVEQLGTFAAEVTRVAREVGMEGKLGGQAEVAGVAGAWRELTDSVNAMASNLTGQVRNISEVMTAVASGDLSKKITVDARGELLQLKDAINTMVDQLRIFAAEVTRVAREVGTEGRLGGQAVVLGVAGTWKDLTDSVNSMANNLTAQVRNIAEVSKAIASGDLTRKVTVDVQGEILELKDTINAMVDQLRAFSAEVTRVAREVGTEGQLGGQAEVPGVAGTWKDLTESVNSMASNLTAQVRNIAEVTTAVANGDLSRKITVDVRGEILELKNTINTMVDQLNAFASEVTRVAREVGTEGKLGGQADVKGVGGTWAALTESVNGMAANLTSQVRNIAEVTTAVAAGDLSRKITVDARGEILELKDTMNAMVDQLRAFSSEVTRVAREVGTEGRLGGQAEVHGVAGTWKDLTDSVNLMASNLTGQVRNIAEVTTAVARGDLSRKITVDVRGEILELKNTFNTMVDQLNAFASEVTRVAREVGTEGRLGGQAEVPGVAGTWKDLTDSVNRMASNLTAQVRNIAEVSTAIANGDLTKKITVDVRGEILELKNTINTMVDQLGAFAAEVSRVAREVGTEGKLGGQADVRGVGGTWKDLTDSVNFMASNLTAQVRNIAEVSTAIARGDLTRKITVDVRGEVLELKNTINTMVDQLGAFAAEVSRVAREVGTEGKLGGQAEVRGVAGTWKELTDNVNGMASNLTAQVRNIADVTTAVANGDLTKKITVEVRGEILELKNTINTMVDQLNAFAGEVTRVAREVGSEGKLGGQANVRGVAGTWKELTDNVNQMAANLTDQVRNIAEVTTAVANGDLSRTITVEVRGEILDLKRTINRMVEQLNAFAGEVTRVAREVGTEGKLGGQAEVKGAAGTWRDLTESVNRMAANLTTQVRGIALVVTAVADGDLKRKLALEARGEIAQLADTINGMTDTLAVFADQVITVAREVGVEGKLGGQARVPGAAGVWRDLTDNVNQLAGNLTNQVRAISSVATAVAQGDLTRTVTVEAAGEVAELKDNVNRMIDTLKETTRKNIDQDWLKSNLARFVRMLQGQRDLLTVANMVLSELAPLVSAQHGLFYIAEGEGRDTVLRLLASYAFTERKRLANRFALGEGIVGQAALERKRILVTEVPNEYVEVTSGLGSAAPRNIVVLPVVYEGDVKAVVELGSFARFSDVNLTFLEQLTESIGIVLQTIAATSRTEELLRRSQALTAELQARQQELTESNVRLEAQTAALRQSQEQLKGQQEELRRANEALEERARLLGAQNAEVERKNREVESGRRLLQEKAEQLALTSRYKSEFLANMSHELRTPLNSLMLLAQLLTENRDGNLSPRQVEWARTIHGSGRDLLGLINDVLDLSKVESGTVTVESGDVRIAEVAAFLESSFRQVAAAKGLSFEVNVDPTLPPTIRTDDRRLRQILKNLLSNAFKFTERGGVRVSVGPADEGWSPDHEILNRADRVVAFAVRDTGIGIPADKRQIIFEAFQQAEGHTARKYGGTGLGLAISRELTRLLGGEIRLESEVGAGSTFTLYLPVAWVPPSRQRREPADAGAVGPTPAMQTAAYSAPPTEPASWTLQTRPEEVEVAPASDDRAAIHPGDRVLLVVDDEEDYAHVILEMGRARGWKGVVAGSVREALRLLSTGLVPSAVVLDLRLPDGTGWVVLDAMKHDARTRSAPVHVVTVASDERDRGRILGAFGFTVKPAGREQLERVIEHLGAVIAREDRRVLLLEPGDEERARVAALLSSPGVEVTAVGDPAAVDPSTRFDCAVMSSRLDAGVLDALVTRLRSETPDLAVVVRVPEGAPSPVPHTVAVPAHADERLLERVSLYIHLEERRLTETQRDLLARARKRPGIEGRRILVVDDDVRNLFALTAALEDHGLRVLFAESGPEALDILRKNHDVDGILMDVMMPGMDGYEAMRAIRAIPELREIPIIALTAKAMPGDRERCLAAGATDYVPKPVEAAELLAHLRLWLER
ncbi:MAG: HAMP domain-containing protein [Myxococcota bacterium]